MQKTTTAATTGTVTEGTSSTQPPAKPDMPKKPVEDENAPAKDPIEKAIEKETLKGAVKDALDGDKVNPDMPAEKITPAPASAPAKVADPKKEVANDAKVKAKAAIKAKKIVEEGDSSSSSDSESSSSDSSSSDEEPAATKKAPTAVKPAKPATDVKTAVAEKVVKKVEKKEAEKKAVKEEVEKKEAKKDPIAAATKSATKSVTKVAKAKNPVDLVKKVTKAVTPKPEKKVTKPVVEKPKPAPVEQKPTLADMVEERQGGAPNKPKIVGDKGRKHIHHRHSMSKTGYAPNTERNFAAEALESLRLSTGRENSSTEPIVIENQQGKPIASSNTA